MSRAFLSLVLIRLIRYARFVYSWFAMPTGNLKKVLWQRGSGIGYRSSKLKVSIQKPALTKEPGLRMHSLHKKRSELEKVS